MGTGRTPGDVLVKKVNNNDDWIEDLLTADDVPVTLTGGDYTGAGISGSDSQELFDSIADRLADVPSSSGFVDLVSNQTVSGNKTFANTIHVSSGILPTSDNAYNIGSPSLRFDCVYASKIVTSGSPQTTMSGGFIGTDNAEDFIIKTNDTARWNFLSTGHLVPATDNSYDIGTSSLGARTAYVDTQVVSPKLTNAGTVTIETSTTDNIIFETNNTARWHILGTGELEGQGTAVNTNIIKNIGNASNLDIAGGSSTSVSNGAVIGLNGNSRATNPGQLSLNAGNVGTGVYINTFGTNQPIHFTTDNTERWIIDGNSGSGALVGTQTTNQIRPNTSDGSDNAFVEILGGGGQGETRGAAMAVWGNEHATTAGQVFIAGGNVVGAQVKVTSFGDNPVILGSNGIDRWEVDGSGNLVGLDDTINVITTDTTDGSDTSSIEIKAGGGGGGVDRGAILALWGNEHSGTGQVYLVTGDKAGGNMRLSTAAAEPIYLNTDSTDRWSIESDGDIVPESDNSYEIGSTSNHVSTVHTVEVQRNDGNDLRLDATTGGIEMAWTSQTRLTITGNFVEPTSNQALNLGRADKSWNGISVQTVENPTVTGLHLSTINGKSLHIRQDDTFRWEFDPAGHIYTTTSGQVDLGSASLPLRTVYADNLSGGAVSGFVDLTSNQTIQGQKTFEDPMTINDTLDLTGDFTLNQTTNLIKTGTSDGSDNASILLAGGGAGSVTRGAQIQIFGNEGSSPGELHFTAGSTANRIAFNAFGTGTDIEFYTANTFRWNMDSSAGIWQGTQTSNVISTDTTNGSDNASLSILSAGSALDGGRGAGITMWGNEGAAAGEIHFITGNTADRMVFNATGAGSDIEFYTANTFRWNMKASDGAWQGTQTTNLITTNTSDGSDNAALQIAAGGGDISETRGASIRLHGNEHATTAGEVNLVAGNVTNGKITITTTANEPIQFRTQGATTRWSVEGGGTLEQDGTNGGDLVLNTNPGLIRQGTSDGSDSRAIQIAAGGSVSETRGASIRMHGNEHSTNGGQINIVGGNVAGAAINIATTTTEPILFQTQGGNTRWSVVSDGHFIPGSDNTYDIGSSSAGVRDLYISRSILDNTDSAGTAGQILTSDGTNAKWQDSPTSSGSQTITLIDNVRSISGVSGGILGNLEVIEFPESADGVVAFSFPVDAQPQRDLELKVLYGPTTTGSGNFKLDLDYNVINLSGDLTPASFTASGTNTDNLVSGDNEELQSMTFTISSSVFSGSAPMIFSGRLTRDTSVGSNYAGDIALVHLYSLIYAEI